MRFSAASRSPRSVRRTGDSHAGFRSELRLPAAARRGRLPLRRRRQISRQFRRRSPPRTPTASLSRTCSRPLPERMLGVQNRHRIFAQPCRAAASLTLICGRVPSQWSLMQVRAVGEYARGSRVVPPSCCRLGCSHEHLPPQAFIGLRRRLGLCEIALAAPNDPSR